MAKCWLFESKLRSKTFPGSFWLLNRMPAIQESQLTGKFFFRVTNRLLNLFKIYDITNFFDVNPS